MLSVQHVLSAACVMDEKTLQQNVGALVFPDAIRAYSGPRQYSHFEKSENGQDVSWWSFPDDMKSVTKESVQESLMNSSHLVSGIRPCAIGEETDMDTFYRTNSYLPEQMFKGVEMHLRQDVAYDAFVREQIDCSRKYAGVFVKDGVIYDGQGVRSLITQMEQQGIYYLAQKLYEEKGITANQEWFEQVIQPALYDAYPDDLAQKTFSFMKIDDVYDDYITRHDWSLKNTVVSDKDYQTFYDDVIESIQAPSAFSSKHRDLPSGGCMLDTSSEFEFC